MKVYQRHFPRSAVPFSDTVEMWVLLLSVVAAVFLLRSDVIGSLVAGTQDFALIGGLVEGFFFTSVFTTIPATVAIVQSAALVPAWKLALIGGFGSMLGDLLIFRFLRSQFADRVLRAAFSPRALRVAARFSRGPLSWVAFLGGVIVIASPLPDEVGLAMMGLSNIRLPVLAFLNFTSHAAGIYLIALAAQGIVG